MALSAFVDRFSLSTAAAGSTIVRTGYGFLPKACVYWWSGTISTVDVVQRFDGKPGLGVAVSATDRRCVGMQQDDGNGTAATDRHHSNVAVIECLTLAGALEGSMDLQSFDSDGQTLVVDDAFATALRVHCLALGGSDLQQAATFQFQVPLATGNSDVSVGFQPDAVLLFSVGLPSAPPAFAPTALLSVGVATGASAQGVMANYDTDAAGTMNTGRYGYSGECVALMSSTAALSHRASLVSMLATGFRLNWLEVDGATQPYVHGLALRGGSYLVGQLLTQTNTTTPIAESGVGFAPTGALFVSHCAPEQTQDTPVAHAAGSIGAMTSASARATQGWISQHGGNGSILNLSLQEDEVYASGSAVSQAAQDGLMDVQSLDSDGFTLIMDDAETAASLITYLAWGDAVVVATPSRQTGPRTVLRAVPRASYF